MRRRLLFVFALLLAGLGTTLVYLYVQGADDRALADHRVHTVLKLVNPVRAGDSVSSATFESYQVTDYITDELSDARGVANLTFRIPVPAGARLTKWMLQPPAAASARGPQIVVQAQYPTTVTVNSKVDLFSKDWRQSLATATVVDLKPGQLTLELPKDFDLSSLSVANNSYQVALVP